MGLNEAIELVERYDRQIAKLENTAIARLKNYLESAYDSLEKQVAKSYPRLAGNATLLQSQRKALILDELGGLLEIVDARRAKSFENTFGNLLRDSTNLGFEVSGLLVEAIGNEKLKGFTNIAVEAVASAANNSYGRLLRHGAVFADTATEIISMGLVQGWGVKRIIQPLQQQLGITKSRAEAIARTESISAYTDAAEQRYKDGEIEEFVWVAIGDRQTCSYCLARHMRIFKVGETRPPIHPSDRCTMLPYRKEWGLDSTSFSKAKEKALQQSEISPNYGLAPFEKARGMTEAPTMRSFD